MPTGSTLDPVRPSTPSTNFLLLVIAAAIVAKTSAFLKPFSEPAEDDPCYDKSGRAVQCIADFVNAAYGKPVKADSVCGDPPSTYCDASLDDHGKVVQVCHTCDSTKTHPARFLTDLHNPNNITCWISEPLSSPTQAVNLTVSLNKKYELTYISLQFCGPKPDSLAIYKSMDYGKTWLPFQFYSSHCRKVFGRTPQVILSRANEQEPLCSDGKSSVDALTGGRIAFSTLEGRPSAYDFDNSPVLQDWITATDITVVLVRTRPWNYAVQDLINDTELTYYSVSDLAIGGRCKCNGHASRCIRKGDDFFCDCRHNTIGKDCERCKAFHFDRPWGRATVHDAHECIGK